MALCLGKWIGWATTAFAVATGAYILYLNRGEWIDFRPERDQQPIEQAAFELERNFVLKRFERTKSGQEREEVYRQFESWTRG